MMIKYSDSHIILFDVIALPLKVVTINHIIAAIPSFFDDFPSMDSFLATINIFMMCTTSDFSYSLATIDK